MDGRDLLGIPRSLEMWVWIAIGVLKNKSCDLSRLREVPKVYAKFVRMVLSLLASWEMGVFIARYYPQTDYEREPVGDCEEVGL